MRSSYDIIKSFLKTEKSTKTEEKLNRYTFIVDRKATKIEIKRAIQDTYKVKVKDVNTCILPGKPKRVRLQTGYTPSYKKATVTLKEGKIETK